MPKRVKSRIASKRKREEGKLNEENIKENIKEKRARRGDGEGDDGDDCDTFINTLIDQPDTFSFLANAAISAKWYLDSASQRHVADNRCHFIFYTQFATPTKFCKGIGGKSLPIVGEGEVEVVYKTGGKTHKAVFKGVYHCPGLGTNLLSFAQLKKTSKMAITDNGFSCQGQKGKVIQFVEENGLYPLQGACLSRTADE